MKSVTARMMFGLLVFLAASVSPPAPAGPPAAQRVSQFRPVSSVTARATVSIRIISGARFGPGQTSGHEGADRRKARIADADGVSHPAELMEFQ